MSAPSSPARLATLIALPIALIAGLTVFGLLGGFSGDPNGDRGAHRRGGTGSPSASTAPGPQSTSPVTVPAPTLRPEAAPVCLALLAKLPPAISGLARRLVTAGNEQNAAYGDPALVLQCGVAPADFPPEAQLLGLSGVCWYTAERPDGTIWTTVDRSVPIQLTVPAGYQPPAQWVIDFSPSIVDTVPLIADGAVC